jgi:hypothetical protein
VMQMLGTYVLLSVRFTDDMRKQRRPGVP